MSRSYRKSPFCGFTKATSEKAFKQSEHRAFRRKESVMLNDPDCWDDFYLPEREMKTTYGPKDGKLYLLSHDDFDAVRYWEKEKRK